jgi:hypothetical protein
MMGDGIDNETNEAGRAMVRGMLVDRLRCEGLRRPKGLSEADHAKNLEHLVDHLAYMAPDNLTALTEAILTHAATPGPGAGFWPVTVLIRQWAQALQPKPFSQHPIIASWLRSREGPVADGGGYLVELLRWLKAHRRALTPADLVRVKEDANNTQARMARARDRIARDMEWPEDRDTLATYQRDLQEARQYVD